MVYSKIVGTGSYLPDDVLRNSDLEKLVLYNIKEDPEKNNPLKTSDEWLKDKGLDERRIISKDMSIADMGIIAAQQALDYSKLNASDIDELIVGCNSSERLFGSVAGEIQDRLGMRKVKSYDIQAGCTSSIYAFDNADAAIKRSFNQYGKEHTVLVVCTDALSRIVNWTDRNTCILFGDGAGAAILKPDENKGILASWLAIYGAGRDALVMPSGISRENIPFAYLDGKISHKEKIMQEAPYFKMGGFDTFKFAVRAMEEAVLEVCSLAGVNHSEIDIINPHDANKRIIDAAINRLKIPQERVYSNIQKYANTSCPSPLINLDKGIREGVIKEDNLICSVAFGAGLTYGATLFRL